MRLPILAAAMFLTAGSSLVSAQERLWNYDQTDKDAYLVFGVPDTDDVGVSFWCELQSDKIKIFVPEADRRLPTGKKLDFDVLVGKRAYHLRGLTTDNKEAGTTSVESELRVSNPLFARLLDADRFGLKVGKARLMFPLQDADLPSLLSACRKP